MRLCRNGDRRGFWRSLGDGDRRRNSRRWLQGSVAVHQLRIQPIVLCKRRLVPVVLQHTGSVAERHAPIGLPVLDAGIAKTRQHKKIKIGGGVVHGVRRLLNCA